MRGVGYTVDANVVILRAMASRSGQESKSGRGVKQELIPTLGVVIVHGRVAQPEIETGEESTASQRSNAN